MAQTRPGAGWMMIDRRDDGIDRRALLAGDAIAALMVLADCGDSGADNGTGMTGAAPASPAAPPSDAEMAQVGYEPDNNDRADVAAGIYPRGMFQDPWQLLGSGPEIGANRVVARVAGR